MRRALLPLLAALPLLFASAPAAASEPTHGEDAAHGLHVEEEEHSFTDTLMHHITDGYDVEVLGFHFETHEAFGMWCVGEAVEGPHGPACDGLDLTPTRLTLFMWAAAILLVLVFGLYARRKYDENGVPTGFNNLLESLVVFVRDELAIANIGKEHGPKWVPLLLTFFFFILFMNLIGLVPWGSTPTGNLAVTGALALIAFIAIQVGGMAGHGAGKYWVHIVPSGVPLALFPLMWVIEFFGLFTKPFALMVRLFANMTAGHAVILSLLGLIFILKTAAVAPISIGFALFIYLLELFVAFLQAYIFTMLTALFIGMASHSH